MHFRKALTWGLLLITALGGASAATRAAPPRARSVAVFPFENLRGTEKGDRLAAALQNALRRGLLRSGKLGVLEDDAAAQWQAKFQLKGGAAPDAAQLEQIGVDAVVQGTIHLVLDLAVLEVWVTGREGSLLKEGSTSLRAELTAHPPEKLMERLLEAIAPSLGASPTPNPVPEPDRWEPLLAFHGLMEKREQEDEGSKGGAFLRKRLAGLAELAESGELKNATPGSALEGRVAGLRASLLLEQALLHSADGKQRRARLEGAFRHAAHAAALEPWNAEALALKGEILFFLKRFYEAKTESSVARLKNPLNGTARVVLAMVAGLSTGAAVEHMQAALLANPFLRSKNRVPGSAPFQGGLLEPFLEKWDHLRLRGGRPGGEREDAKLKEGIAHFENERWKEAARALREAADNDAYDHRPLLYLARIITKTGAPLDAANHLKKLTTEFPEQPDVFFHLGIALELGKAYPGAISAFQKALAFRPGDKLAEFHVGTAELANEEWENASETFRGILDQDENNSGAWLRFGIANARLNNWGPAEQALRRTLELDPGSPDATQWLEWMRKERGR